MSGYTQRPAGQQGYNSNPSAQGYYVPPTSGNQEWDQFFRQQHAPDIPQNAQNRGPVSVTLANGRGTRYGEIPVSVPVIGGRDVYKQGPGNSTYTTSVATRGSNEYQPRNDQYLPYEHSQQQQVGYYPGTVNDHMDRTQGTGGGIYQPQLQQQQQRQVAPSGAYGATSVDQDYRAEAAHSTTGYRQSQNPVRSSESPSSYPVQSTQQQQSTLHAYQSRIGVGVVAGPQTVYSSQGAQAAAALSRQGMSEAQGQAAHSDYRHYQQQQPLQQQGRLQGAAVSASYQQQVYADQVPSTVQNPNPGLYQQKPQGTLNVSSNLDPRDVRAQRVGASGAAYSKPSTTVYGSNDPQSLHYQPTLQHGHQPGREQTLHHQGSQIYQRQTTAAASAAYGNPSAGTAAAVNSYDSGYQVQGGVGSATTHTGAPRIGTSSFQPGQQQQQQHIWQGDQPSGQTIGYRPQQQQQQQAQRYHQQQQEMGDRSHRPGFDSGPDVSAGFEEQTTSVYGRSTNIQNVQPQQEYTAAHSVLETHPHPLPQVATSYSQQAAEAARAARNFSTAKPATYGSVAPTLAIPPVSYSQQQQHQLQSPYSAPPSNRYEPIPGSDSGAPYNRSTATAASSAVYPPTAGFAGSSRGSQGASGRGRGDRSVSGRGSAGTGAGAPSAEARRFENDRSNASDLPSKRKSAFPSTQARSRVARSESRSPSRTRGGGSGGGSRRVGGGSSADVPAASSSKIDFAKSSLSILSENFNIPLINRYSQALSPVDLYTRFPRLYVPADFLRVEMDWFSVIDGINADRIRRLPTTVALKFEDKAGILHNTISIPEAPKPTYVTPDPVPTSFFEDGAVPAVTTRALGGSLVSTTFIATNTPRPVKFNARVIVSVGMDDIENERIDCNLPRKLKVLCGRRKGGIMLLGGAWCQELDGGDPLHNRSCLLNTARRTVLAQAMVDIFRFTSTTKLLELHYHRPQEEIRGKVFPEQDEITAIFLCSAIPSHELHISEEEFAATWAMFRARAGGRHVGPDLSMDSETAAALVVSPQLFLPANTLQEVSAETPPVAAESAAVDPEVKKEEEHLTQIEAEEIPDSSLPPHAKLDTTPASPEGMQEVHAAAMQVAESVALSVLGEEDGGGGACGGSLSDTHITDVIKVEISTGASTQLENQAPTPSSLPTALDANSTSSAGVKPPTSERSLELTKPEAPCLLLCPQPLLADSANDASRKLDAISLRLLPLSSVLSYAQDDVNERIFEASLAAEVMRSALAIAYANIITDFVMSEHAATPATFPADPRVKSSVRVLRFIARRLVGKSRQLVPTTSSQPQTQSLIQAEGQSGVDNEQAEVDKVEWLVDKGKLEVEPAMISLTEETEEQEYIDDVGDVTAAASGNPEGNFGEEAKDIVCSDASDSFPLPGASHSDGEAAMATESSDFSSSPASANSTVVAPVTTSEEKVTGGTVATTIGEDAMDETLINEISEDEARSWRRTFVSACRWFDVAQQRFIRADHLELIMQSSARHFFHWLQTFIPTLQKGLRVPSRSETGAASLSHFR